jgi:hypothetical protein
MKMMFSASSNGRWAAVEVHADPVTGRSGVVKSEASPAGWHRCGQLPDGRLVSQQGSGAEGPDGPMQILKRALRT